MTISPLTEVFAEPETIRTSSPPIPVTTQVVRYVSLALVKLVPVTYSVPLVDEVAGVEVTGAVVVTVAVIVVVDVKVVALGTSAKTVDADVSVSVMAVVLVTVVAVPK